MLKRSLSLAAAVAALALASASFAASPPAAAPPGERAEFVEFGKDIGAAPLAIAASGQGAASALKAYEQKRQAQPVPAARQAPAWLHRVTSGWIGAEHGGGSAGSPVCWIPPDDGSELLTAYQAVHPHPRK